jgi:acyl-CoA synthetase (NDP forming)
MDLTEQLNHIFSPDSVAIVGASSSPGKLGNIIVSNLVEAGFKGRIYPINPSGTELRGLKVYRSMADIPEDIDAAIIAVPAKQTVSAVEGCAARNAKGAIIVAGGFKETGTDIGRELESKITGIANRNGMKIVGPNTVGLLNPKVRFNASFQKSYNLCKTGNVALAAQSGGVCSYTVHAFINNNIGVSKATGLGNRCNLDFDEILTYFGQDEQTRVITLYIEGLDSPQRFLDIAKKIVRQKPIIAYKGARSERVSKSTLSHTGTLAGKYEFYKAAFHQAGIITVTSLNDLVDIAKALSLQPPAAGNRIAVVNPQAGPGIITADKCYDLGMKLATFSPATEQKLRQLGYPPQAGDNPFDLAWIGWNADTGREILKVILADNSADGVIIVGAAFRTNLKLMKALADMVKSFNTPVAISTDSPKNMVTTQIEAVEESGFPVYPTPERAAVGMHGLVKYGEILKSRER